MPINLQQLYENTLVLKSQLGDGEAFGKLLEIFGPRLALFIQRMVQNSGIDSADVTQEIWLAIYRALPKLKDISKFRAWAFRIARDRIYREYRKRKIHSQNADLPPVEEMAEASPEIDSERKEALDACLCQIAPEHRETLVLRFFEEMSYEDIALVTGVTIGTVRSRIHYGKQALKNVWENKNYE